MTVETGRLEPDAVRRMFDRIAPVYDVMNRAMTAGLDRRWRAETARAVVSPGDRVLDACCGTGDLAIAAQRAGGKVTGLDFSERMLERARAKSSAVEWIQGDALALPFENGSFDAATVGFGVRNLESLERGLAELRRVLRSGGRLGVLEITRPRGALAAGGKRLRPLLVFLTAPEGTDPLPAGAAVELVHTATLVHDDLIDRAEYRRGRASAWACHGPAAARAAGDYLFARAFAELAD